ncbi:MAG TPA: hypothetical protein VIC84_15995 [Blastocatellia bacterium]|jgi:hypothetical protein
MAKPESSVSCREDLYARLCDPECVTCHPNAVLEENDEATFQWAPRDVAGAQRMPPPGTPLRRSSVMDFPSALGIQSKLDLKRAA